MRCHAQVTGRAPVTGRVAFFLRYVRALERTVDETLAAKAADTKVADAKVVDTKAADAKAGDVSRR